MRKVFRLIFFFLLLSSSCKSQEQNFNRSSTWAKKVENTPVTNFYSIDSLVFRSGQPNAKQMQFLDQMGIKTVINLRDKKNDKKKASKTSLQLIHIPINTWKISYKDILSSLIEIEKSEKPILIHCLHGSDRTGCIIACYRLVYQNWTKQEAINELIEGGYGYHASWFPNILKLITELDVEKLKSDLKQKGKN